MTRFLISMSLAFVALPLCAQPLINTPAPDFVLADTAGKVRSLQEFRGKHVVLEWTNHECPFVMKHYGGGNMQSLQKHLTDRGVVWLSVISSAPGKQGHVSPARADELTRERKATPTAVLLDPDGAAGRAYGAKTTPHMYLIDPGGVLRYMGGIDSVPTADPADIVDATPYLKIATLQSLGGAPIEYPSTRPYGCAVKY